MSFVFSQVSHITLLHYYKKMSDDGSFLKKQPCICIFPPKNLVMSEKSSNFAADYKNEEVLLGIRSVCMGNAHCFLQHDVGEGYSPP